MKGFRKADALPRLTNEAFGKFLRDMERLSARLGGGSDWERRETTWREVGLQFIHAGPARARVVYITKSSFLRHRKRPRPIDSMIKGAALFHRSMPLCPAYATPVAAEAKR